MEEAVAPEFPAHLNERHVVAEALLGGTRISDTSIPADDFNDEKIGKLMVHWNWKLTQRTPATRNHCQTHTEALRQQVSNRDSGFGDDTSMML
ncbi:unnamed protein product [Bursaphelenchus xylophilus]|nr:unnamed protein product [Bursaphelenchus xylophilus]CAG9088478.1 unnamed protein product [Bursaphelenchus xylophilus]